MSDPFWLGLHHMQIAIPRGSEDECRNFYTGVLGLTEVPKPPALAVKGGLWYRTGNLELHLGPDDDFHPAKRSNPSITVTNLDAVAEKLMQASVEFSFDTNYPGHRRIHTFDNLGNRLEFFEV